MSHIEIKLIHDVTPELKHFINRILRKNDMLSTKKQAELIALISTIAAGKASDPALVAKVDDLVEKMTDNNITDEQQQEAIEALAHQLAAGNPPEGPVVSSLSSHNGGIAGGEAVVVSGTGFTDASVVNFGDVSVGFTTESDTMITTQAPAHEDGTVNVTVETPKGKSVAGVANEYTYT